MGNQHHLLQASLVGSSKLLTGFQQTHIGERPSSRPVEPIREQPENEDAGDFLRESALEQRSEERVELGTGNNPLGNTSTIEDGMRQIERMNAGTKTSFYHTGFQQLASGKATQSDFFNATASKMHEQTSQHVFADQITRLMGKTGTNNMVVVQEEESREFYVGHDQSYRQEPNLYQPTTFRQEPASFA